MKLVEILKIPALKPRDPNYRIMRSKANAAGKMRDKKQDFKNGIEKHQKKPALDEAVRMPYRMRVQGNFGHITTKWTDVFLPYSDLDLLDTAINKNSEAIIRPLISNTLARNIPAADFKFTVISSDLSLKDRLLKIKIKYTLPALPERSATLLIRD